MLDKSSENVVWIVKDSQELMVVQRYLTTGVPIVCSKDSSLAVNLRWSNCIWREFMSN